MLHRAIAKTGRPIVLSLSPGPTSPGLVAEIRPYAQMWRISDDIWDYWRNTNHFPRTLHDQFELAAAWAPYAAPGSWPDADMLPLGYLGPEPGDGKARDSRLTHEEQRMMVTLWSMMRSPLILGANLTKLDAWTTSLVTNRDILDIDQNAHDQRQVAREGRRSSHGQLPAKTACATWRCSTSAIATIVSRTPMPSTIWRPRRITAGNFGRRGSRAVG